jgi:hypothetical protein
LAFLHGDLIWHPDGIDASFEDKEVFN